MPRRSDHVECENTGVCSCECDCSDCSKDDSPMRPTNKDNLPPRRRACGNCGRLGHLTRTCTAPAKAHDKIGVEVEGWWRDFRAVRAVADNWHMPGHDDGSLRYDESGETVAYEFCTRPGSLGEAISQVTAIYPDKQDNSAGMHIHMSFKDPADISCLASGEFFAYFRERWEAWGTRMNVHPSSAFWSRLRGENEYCQLNIADSHTTQRQLRGGTRYRQLNFTSFERHGTMELRMLPLFRDARLAVAAMEEWVAIVEDFLAERADTYLSRFDRAPAFDPEVDFPAAVIRTESVEIGPVVAIESERTVEIAAMAERTVESEIDLIPVTPCTPGHVRLFGGPAAVRNHVTRIMRELGA